jgi:hypothetical protein
LLLCCKKICLEKEVECGFNLSIPSELVRESLTSYESGGIFVVVGCQLL